MDGTTYRTLALLLQLGILSFMFWIGVGTPSVSAQGHTTRKDGPAQTIRTSDTVRGLSDIQPPIGKCSLAVLRVVLRSKELGAALRPYYGYFRMNNSAMTAVQPSWMGPLIQSDARLGQAVRISVSDATFPGEQTLNYGDNHGVSLIVNRHFQFDLDPPSYFRNHSSAHRDGFGNAGAQMKWRIVSGNAEHGNYAISALIYHAFAPRVYQNQMLSSYYIPAVVAGRGFGRIAAITEVGGVLPTAKIAQQGRGIEWNTTAQVHSSARTWFEVEDNTLFNYAGPFDGKTQNFLTPAAFYSIPRRMWKPDHATLVVGSGMQIATSSFHFYNHNLISEIRMAF